MRKIYTWLALLVATTFCVNSVSQKSDWLINGSHFKSDVTEINGFVTLSNGLVSRTISLSPDGATTGFENQCVATGFEKIILSFGSGFDIEDTAKANLDKYKVLTGYEHNKGISIGGWPWGLSYSP